MVQEIGTADDGGGGKRLQPKLCGKQMLQSQQQRPHAPISALCALLPLRNQHRFVWGPGPAVPFPTDPLADFEERLHVDRVE